MRSTWVAVPGEKRENRGQRSVAIIGASFIQKDGMGIGLCIANGNHLCRDNIVSKGGKLVGFFGWGVHTEIACVDVRHISSASERWKSTGMGTTTGNAYR